MGLSWSSEIRIRHRIPVRIQAAAAFAGLLVVVACGSTSTAQRPSPSPVASASAVASPTAGSSAFPSPTPGGAPAVPGVPVSCSSQVPPSHQLALVKLRGVAGVIVRDITDINHPVSRCTIGGGAFFRFYDESHISYIAMPANVALGAPGSLYLVDLRAGTTSLVRSWANGGFASWIYNWSPDGRILTYLSSDPAGVQWHILSAAGDRLLANLGQVAARGIDSNNDDAMVGFSADGKYVAVEQTFTQGKGAGGATTPIQVNRVSDGSVAYTRTDGTMAVWAGTGAQLLFRTSAGVQSWSQSGSVVQVAAGSSWIHPWASSDGSRVAFLELNAQTNHVGLVLDLTSGATHALSAQPRAQIAFLNSTLVWYAGEAICTTATPCGLGGPPLSGSYYIYDLGSDVESGSIDTYVYDSWPHVVGQT